MKNCRPMQQKSLEPYRSVVGRFIQRNLAMGGQDSSMLFVSYNEGTSTKMHMDMADSLFQQVVGRKRWLFVDIEYASELKIWAETLNLVYISGYDVHHEAVPAHVPVREIVLNP